MKKLFAVLGVLLLLAAGAFKMTGQNLPGTSGNPSTLSRPGGAFYAPGFFWNARVISGNSSTGASQSIVIAGNAAGGAGGLQLPDGTTIPLQAVFSTLTPITVDWGQGAQETVTPSSVSVGTCPAGNIGVGGSMQCVTVVGTFVNTHGQSAVVIDGTFGAQTAVNYANSLGGGVVMVDPAWAQMGGTTALLAGLIPFANVAIQDMRNGIPSYWDITPNTAAFIATPTALTAQAACDATHSFCSDASVAGTWTSGQVFGCVAYVDIAGNEGACSTTANIGTTVVSKAIDVGTPAASTGAVGYTIYLSLVGGSYAFAYQVPITSSICTMTTLETVTPACAVTNTNYGQTGSILGKTALFAGGAVVPAITVNTSPIALQLGVASTTADYVGNSNAHTIYAYAPGSSGPSGVQQASLAFTAGPATVATTVPQVIGTLSIPTGFMNFVGRTIRVCGKEQMTGASGTIELIQLWWDGAGSNAAGVPVKIADLSATAGPNTAAAYNGNFCVTLSTTVSGAGVTAGSIIGGKSDWNYYLASAPTAIFVGGDKLTAAVASLNLAGGAGFTTRLHVVQLHTTGTDVSPQLINLTAELLN